MDAPPPAPALAEPGTPDPAAEQARQRTERHLRMLAELAEIGMDLTRALHQRTIAEAAQAPAEAPAKPARDPALQFARLARAIRNIIALEARLAAGPSSRAKSHPAAEAVDPAVVRKQLERTIQIRRGVIDAIEAAGGSRRENWLVKLERELKKDAADPNPPPIAEAILRIRRDIRIRPLIPPGPAEEPWTEDEEPEPDKPEQALEVQPETPAEPEAPPPAATWQGFPVVSPAASPAPAAAQATVPQAQAPPAFTPAPRGRSLAGWAHGAR